MPKAAWLALALTCCIGGAAMFAFAIDTHWQQVRGTATVLAHRTIVMLRTLGALAWFAALTACLQADHATIAVLVWVMSLAAAALVVAFTLAWRPQWLAWLVAWSD